jgi:hypothetical protein
MHYRPCENTVSQQSIGLREEGMALLPTFPQPPLLEHPVTQGIREDPRDHRKVKPREVSKTFREGLASLGTLAGVLTMPWHRPTADLGPLYLSSCGALRMEWGTPILLRWVPT